MDWDPSREYDSQTFSEDYNLHGASGRSFDHPSVTRDDHFLRGVLNSLDNEDQQQPPREGEDEDDDRSSIDDADLGLIVDIVDGKNPPQQQQRRRGLPPVQFHETDDNSRASIMRYLIDGTQDQEEIQQQLHHQDSPHFDPARQQQYYQEDNQHEHNFTDYSGSTPRRQVRNSFLDHRNSPRASPMTPRRTIPVRQQQQHQQQYSEQIHQPQQLTRRLRSVSIDERPTGIPQRPLGIPQRPSGIPQRSGLVAYSRTALAGISSLSTAAAEAPPTQSPMRRTSATTTTTTTTRTEELDGQRITNFADLPKPTFRSAMKAPKNYGSGANYTNDAAQQQQNSRSKLGRHIQLPDESLHAEEEDEEEGDEVEQGLEEEEERQQDRDEEAEEGEEEEEEHESWEPVVHPQEPSAQDVDEDIIADEPSSPTKEKEVMPVDVLEAGAESTAPPISTSSVPGPSKFTRISKKNNNSPAKIVLPIVPTPQDEREQEQKVHQTVKDLKALLGRLGLSPLTATLEGSMDELTDNVVEEGGLCEMMGLVHKLGGMYERQKEVIHQMTDQIIASEIGEGSSDGNNNNNNNHESEESDRKIAELTRQLEETQAKLYESQKDNQVLKDRRNTMIDKVEEDNVKLRQMLLELKSSPAQTEAEPVEQAKLPQPQAVDPGWKDHVTKIEQELQALKTTLNLAPILSGVAMTTPATSSSQEQEDLEERMTEMVLENRRLKLSNKKLTQQLLETTADDNVDERVEKAMVEYKSILQDIMARVGVNRESEILPALNTIELVVQDLPQLRRFIAKAERVIWEQEIMEGLVCVQKARSSRTKSNKNGKEKRPNDDLLEPEIPPGRTCSQPLEVTLERLQEWSELLDVLNHVEFADELDDDNVTVVPLGKSRDSY